MFSKRSSQFAHQETMCESLLKELQVLLLLSIMLLISFGSSIVP
jgi:hypothetical protein